METDWLIVGAGLTGATLAERIASQRGDRVLVIDQRDHVGGNSYDERDDRGILIHVYGAHIFHTNSQQVFEYLSGFTSWVPYEHKVLASVEGRLVPLPFNLNSIDRLFDQFYAERLRGRLIAAFGEGARVPILQLRQSVDPDLTFLADFVYRNVFENYTRKQWGLTPEELLPTVTARVPILVSRDDRYFQDCYQAMPRDGYASMVSRMLSHPNIRVNLKTPWREVRGQITYKHLVFTGPIDEYFEYKYGMLPYRSLRFEKQTHEKQRYQEAAVVNYPNEHAYTRITEHKLLTNQVHQATAIYLEYPQAHDPNVSIPYYPIPAPANLEIFKQYELAAKELTGRVIFAGRLADYQYYNMDQAVARALSIFRKLGNAAGDEC